MADVDSHPLQPTPIVDLVPSCVGLIEITLERLGTYVLDGPWCGVAVLWHQKRSPCNRISPSPVGPTPSLESTLPETWDPMEQDSSSEDATGTTLSSSGSPWLPDRCFRVRLRGHNRLNMDVCGPGWDASPTRRPLNPYRATSRGVRLVLVLLELPSSPRTERLEL